MPPYLNDVFNSIIFSRFIHVVAYICIWFFFLLMNNISSYAYARFDLSLHQLMSIWVVSIFSLLWIMHLWTFMNRFLCKYSFHFSWVNNREAKLLGCVVTLSLTFGEITRLFNKVVAFQYTFFCHQCTRILIFSHSHQHLLYYCCCNLVMIIMTIILRDVKNSSITILRWISLMG